MRPSAHSRTHRSNSRFIFLRISVSVIRGAVPLKRLTTLVFRRERRKIEECSDLVRVYMAASLVHHVKLFQFLYTKKKFWIDAFVMTSSCSFLFSRLYSGCPDSSSICFCKIVCLLQENPVKFAQIVSLIMCPRVASVGGPKFLGTLLHV